MIGYRNYSTIFIIAAFGPYISLNSGIRVENLIIYPIAMMVLLDYTFSRSLKINRAILTIFYLWFGAFVYLLVRTIFGGEELNFTAVLAEIKNFTQPMAVLLVFMTSHRLTIKKSEHRLKMACRVTIALLGVNTLWSILSLFVDLGPINQFFWGGGLDSVATRALTNGRITGIFNQPMEAGAAYSIGVFSWLYLVSRDIIKINFKLVVFLILLIIGGILSVSKLFIIVGLFLSLIYIFSIQRLRRQMGKIILMFFSLGFIPFYYLTNTWEGLSYLARFIDIGTIQKIGFLNFITAGRYGGQNSQQSDLFLQVWASNPIYGQGLGSQRVFDSAFFHFFGDGGLIGLIFYLIILISFVASGLRFLRHRELAYESRLYWFIIVFATVASFGAPIMTLNRASVIYWVYIGMLLQHLQLVANSKYENKNTKNVSGVTRQLMVMS